MYLAEQRGRTVLRIASPRCKLIITADIFLPTTETSCRRNPRKTTNNNCIKWCYSTITHARTLLTWQKSLHELGWEVIPHPPYISDLAPSDFHLSRSLSNNLQGISSADENVLRTRFDNLNSKPRDLYRCWIEKLLQRWQNVVNSEGEYIVDDWFLSYVCIWCGQ